MKRKPVYHLSIILYFIIFYHQGNFQNQAIVFENKICEYANHILRAGHFKGCSQEDVYSLKKSIAILIRSLTEENVPETKDEDIVLATVKYFSYSEIEVLKQQY